MVEVKSTLGWGVVGTGDISRYVTSDLRLLAQARRVAVCSRSIESAQAFAEEFEFEVGYDSLEHMLSDADVDVVYIGTPHSTHARIAVQALEAGKHVLIEKPLGISANEVETVKAAAEANGRFAMEGMWMKFHPYYRAMLAEVQTGAIGEASSVQASFGLPFGEPESTRWSRELASSTLLDQGIYPVTLVHDLFGPPTSIIASAATRSDGVDVSMEATLTYPDGKYAQVAASMVGYLNPSASINGTGGWIDLPAPFWATDRYTQHAGSIGDALMNPTTAVFDREGMGYVPMLRAVTDAISDGLLEHPTHTLDATAAVARLLDRIRAASPRNEPQLENHR